MKTDISIQSLTLMFFGAALLTGGLDNTLAQFHQGQCPRSGRQCNGCQLVDNCTEQEGVYITGTTHLETCQNNEACDAAKGEAQCVADATCRYRKFTCPLNLAKEEVFPDAYSCVEYHVCQDGHPIDYTCGPRQIFDPKEKTCVTAQNSECLTTPVPLCEEPGIKWSIPDTDYEYICMEELSLYRVVYPQISLREERETSKSDASTDEMMAITSEPLASLTPDTGTTPTSEPGITPTSEPGTNPTSKPGSTPSSEPGSNPTSEPGTTLTSEPGTTPTSEPGTNPTPEPGTTPTSEPGTTLTSGPGTTPTSEPGTPSTSEPMTTTTSEPGTTPTSVTGTTQSSETKPPVTNGTFETTPTIPTELTTQNSFSCSVVGYYAVPDDCRSYYLCYLLPNNSLAYVERICRSGSHFNELEQRCVPGTCTNYPSSTSPVTVVTMPPPYNCQSAGYFPDSDCCRCYYICYSLGSGYGLTHKCCRSGSHFDLVQKICTRPGTCVPSENCK